MGKERSNEMARISSPQGLSLAKEQLLGSMRARASRSMVLDDVTSHRMRTVRMAWLLIFYLSATSGQGGPATAHFTTKVRCEQAGEAIKTRWPEGYKGHICVQTSTVAADQ